MESIPHPTAAIGRRFAPLDASFAQSLSDFYALARREAPVCYVPQFDLWLVTRYDDIVAVLRDTRRFSSWVAAEPPEPLPLEVLEIMKDGYPLTRMIIGEDPPAHARTRASVSAAFGPRRIAAMSPTIRVIAHELIDTFAAEGHADILKQFAYLLPMTVIVDMLGIQRDYMDQVKSWHDATNFAFFMPGVPCEQRIAHAREAVKYQHYLGRLVEDRRASPRDDLITSLVEGRAQGEEPLSTGEIVWMLIFLVGAGNEATPNLIANMMLLLLENPEQWRAVSEDPSLYAAAVEETLRVEPSFLLLRRATTEPVEIGGVVIPKGATLGLLDGSGNIDENVFETGKHFDVRCSHPKPHLAFGNGIHYCAGAPLGRLEGRISLQALRERLPNLRLMPGFTAVYEPSIFIRGLQELSLVWDAP